MKGFSASLDMRRCKDWDNKDQISRSVVSDSLPPHESQHARPPYHHQLPEFTQTHVHWVSDAIQPSHPLSSPSPPAFNLSQHQGLFKWVSSATGGQSIGVSVSASVLPMNIQGWFLLVLTPVISLLFKGLSRDFSRTTIKRYQFFGTQPTLLSNSQICTWLLGKSQFWLYGPLFPK